MIRWSAHLSMLFTEHDPLARPGAARAAGFELVESWWPPADDLEGWVDAVRSAGVGVTCLNAGGGDIVAGERGFCNLPERDAETFPAVRAALALAEQVRCPCVNVLPGRLVAERPAADQLAHAASVYRQLGDLAAGSGRTIVVEPINDIDVPGYLTPTPAATAALLERVDHPNVRMLFDAYHCARAGGDPVADVGGFIGMISHVQYADAPGRGAPGTGNVPIHRFVDALERAGYDGAIGLEYAPGGPTVPTLAFLGDV